MSEDLNDPPDHLSWSQVSTILNDMPHGCETRWAFERIAGIPWSPSKAMRVGSAFDAAVTELFKTRAKNGGDPATPLDTRAAMDALLWEVEGLLADPDDEVELRGVANLLGPTLVKYAELHARTPAMAVQQGVTFYVDGTIPVQGYLDRLDRGRIVTDLKLTGQTPSFDKATGMCVDDRLEMWGLQLAFYACALESEALEADVGFSWPVACNVDVVTVRANMVTPRIDIIPVVVEEDQRDRVHDLVRRAWWVSRSGVYRANPGDSCSRCAYTEICRASQEVQVVPFRTLWAKLT